MKVVVFAIKAHILGLLASILITVPQSAEAVRLNTIECQEEDPLSLAQVGASCEAEFLCNFFGCKKHELPPVEPV